MSDTTTSVNSSPSTAATYSPVVLPESPACSTPQRNLTGIPRVARDTAADIYNSIQQWNAMHIKGASIVKEIAMLKSDNMQMYPEGLELKTISLAETVDTLRIIIDNLEIYARQLKSLIELHKSLVPMFISWPVEKMSEVGELIYNSYNQEYKLKTFIAENIPHVTNKDKLMFYAASWAHQPYITDEVTVALESFLTEIGHRSKT